MTIEILDAARAPCSATYSSEAPAGGGRGRGGRGGGGAAPAADPDDPEAAPAAGRFGRGNPNVARVTKVAGMNRFIWDVRNQAGLSVPPGAYQVRLKVGDKVLTQPFTVLIDPQRRRRWRHGRGSEGAVRAQHADARARRRGEPDAGPRARGAGRSEGGDRR